MNQQMIILLASSDGIQNCSSSFSVNPMFVKSMKPSLVLQNEIPVSVHCQEVVFFSVLLKSECSVRDKIQLYIGYLFCIFMSLLVIYSNSKLVLVPLLCSLFHGFQYATYRVMHFCHYSFMKFCWRALSSCDINCGSNYSRLVHVYSNGRHGWLARAS